MHVALEIVGLVVIVATVAGLAERFGLSAPLLLVAAGVGVSFVPGAPEVHLEPELVLLGFLPPLLYAAAIRTSLIDFRANKQAILLLSVGLVAFTTVVVGLTAWWVVPALTLPAAFAIGAVVAPPDAVAATAVARRVGMPRRLVSILEGESLVNDATALVALHTAIAALTVHVTPLEVGWDFIVAAGGGVLVGGVAAVLLTFVRKRIDEPVLDTTLSFTAPWIAFLPAEEIHASGVIAVVVTGLVLGHTSPRVQSASSRIAERHNWRTVQFLLENAVFLLIGLQLRGLIEDVSESEMGRSEIVVGCVAILLATIAARIIWVFVAVAAYKYGPPGMRERAWPWQHALVVSWAGMRGVVTLAAVFLLPEEDTPGVEFLRLAAFVVVAGTLLLHGLTLPWLVRRLQLPVPDAAEDALQTAALLQDASRAGLDRLEEAASDKDPDEVIEQLRSRANSRTNAAWERLGRAHSEVEPPAAAYRRLRLEMLEAERVSILDNRDRGVYDDEVLREALQAIDLEESLLDRIEDTQARIDRELVTDSQRAGDCEHLRDAGRVAVPTTPEGCEDCLEIGSRWVHLRLCLTCGHVGCCDSSPNKHAEAHFHETSHPVVRSFEPGEGWRWCYPDKLLD